MFEIYIYDSDNNHFDTLELPFVPRQGEYLRYEDFDLIIDNVGYNLQEKITITIHVTTAKRNYENQITEEENESEEQNQQDRSSQSQIGQASNGQESGDETQEESEPQKFTGGQLRAARIIVWILTFFIISVLSYFGMNKIVQSRAESICPKQDSIQLIPGTAGPKLNLPDEEDEPPPPPHKGTYL